MTETSNCRTWLSEEQSARSCSILGATRIDNLKNDAVNLIDRVIKEDACSAYRRKKKRGISGGTTGSK